MQTVTYSVPSAWRLRWLVCIRNGVWVLSRRALKPHKPHSVQLPRISPESLAADQYSRWTSKNTLNDLIRRNACQEVTDVADDSAKPPGPAEHMTDASWDVSRKVRKKRYVKVVRTLAHAYAEIHTETLLSLDLFLRFFAEIKTLELLIDGFGFIHCLRSSSPYWTWYDHFLVQLWCTVRDGRWCALNFSTR